MSSHYKYLSETDISSTPSMLHVQLFWLLDGVKMFVLVSSDCCNRNIIDSHGLSNRNLFLFVQEASKSKIRVLASPMSGEGLLPGL